MILIHTALRWEAEPLIKQFSLKRDLTEKGFELFYSPELALIIGGIGQINAAVATTLLVGRFRSPSAIINFGTAGKRDSLGEIFVINKIHDHTTNRCLIPDRLLRSEIQEGALESFATPVTSTEALRNPDSLVDMEASGFFQAASSFHRSSIIHIVKIVSDSLECGALSQQRVHNLIEPHMSTLKSFISSTRSLGETSHDILSQDQLFKISSTAQQLGFTYSQERLLIEAARKGALESRLSNELLDKVSQMTAGERPNRKILFKRAYELLSAS